MENCFNGIIYMERGVIPYVDGCKCIHPETRKIHDTVVADDSVSYNEANERVVEFAQYANYYDPNDEYRNREYFELENAHDHKEIWVLTSWFSDNKCNYVRVYWLPKDLSLYPVQKWWD